MIFTSLKILCALTDVEGWCHWKALCSKAKLWISWQKVKTKKSCRVLLICLARFRLISDYAAVVARIMDRLQSPSGTFHAQKSYLIIKNKRQTALINIVRFRIFINLTFRMQFNIYFQKWSKVTQLKKMTRLYIFKNYKGSGNDIKNLKFLIVMNTKGNS